MFTEFIYRFPVIYFGITINLMLTCKDKRKMVAKPLWSLLLDLSIVKFLVDKFIINRKTLIINEDFFKMVESEVKENYSLFENNFILMVN